MLTPHSLAMALGSVGDVVLVMHAQVAQQALMGCFTSPSHIRVREGSSGLNPSVVQHPKADSNTQHTALHPESLAGEEPKGRGMRPSPCPPRPVGLQSQYVPRAHGSRQQANIVRAEVAVANGFFQAVQKITLQPSAIDGATLAGKPWLKCMD